VRFGDSSLLMSSKGRGVLQDGAEARLAGNNLSRRNMNSLRAIQRALMAIGIILLGFYFGTRGEGTFSSYMAIRAFEASQRPAPAKAALSSETADLHADVSLWSEQRIEAYERSLTQHAEQPLALLRVPKIHLEVPVFEGTDDLTLNRGVGRIQGTAHPGAEGNLGIAGHRDGYFRGLKEIATGDRMDLVMPGRTETFVVDRIQIVDPANVSVLWPGAASSVTLVTCYPFYFVGSAPERYIVHGSLVAPEASSNFIAARH
jgi:sortase A